MADLSITAADVNKVSGSQLSGTAGAAITAGQVVYVDATDANKIKVASNATSAAVAAAVGISLVEDARDGQPVTYQTTGEIDIGAVVVVGEIYVLGASGAIHPHSDLLATEYMTVIGVGKTASTISLALSASGFQLASAGSTGNVTTAASDIAKVSGDVESATSGTAGIVGGRCVYADSSGLVQIASNALEASSQIAGLCLHAAGGLSQPITYQTTGEITVNSSNVLTIGELYVLSNTGRFSPAGDVASSDWVALLGVAKTQTSLVINLFPAGVQRA